MQPRRGDRTRLRVRPEDEEAREVVHPRSGPAVPRDGVELRVREAEREALEQRAEDDVRDPAEQAATKRKNAPANSRAAAPARHPRSPLNAASTSFAAAAAAKKMYTNPDAKVTESHPRSARCGGLARGVEYSPTASATSATHSATIVRRRRSAACLVRSW